MAFSYTGGGGFLGRSRFRGFSAVSDINIVPLVDVVMVLLVIFMLTAQVMEFGMEVDVPRVNQIKDSTQELPVITITKNGWLYLNENEVNINSLASAIERRFGRVNAVYVRADKDAIWDVVAQVIAALGEAKIHPNMVTQPVDEAERARRRR
ncbi:MAG: biopolymer transporter ExbD [Bryobacteraceae bacterium]|jgi:biopolymer transport protein ExbD